VGLRDLVQALRQLAHRHVHGTWGVARLPFVGLAHVEQCAALRELLGQLLRLHARDLVTGNWSSHAPDAATTPAARACKAADDESPRPGVPGGAVRRSGRGQCAFSAPAPVSERTSISAYLAGS